MKIPLLLTEDIIRKRLKDTLTGGVNFMYQSLPMEENLQSFRQAAVLLPLFFYNDDWHLLYTRRAETLPDHKGQVSFPGGAVEPGDDNLVETALREAEEEIGLHPDDIRILGQMDQAVTVSSYLITPIVGIIPWPYRFSPSTAEVSRIFSIPLPWLADPRNHEERLHYNSRVGASQMVVFFHRFDGEDLWGISARLTLDLLERLGISDNR